MRQRGGRFTTKVIVLVADSMALREGADLTKVGEIVELAKRALAFWSGKLRLSLEVILSSEIERSEEYQALVRSLEGEFTDLPLEKQQYFLSQTANTIFLYNQGVRVKLGWQMSKRGVSDEGVFDERCAKTGRVPELQCLYAKAGLKKEGHLEAPPYIALLGDERPRFGVSEFYPLTKRHVARWSSMFEVCAALFPGEYVSTEDKTTDVMRVIQSLSGAA